MAALRVLLDRAIPRQVKSVVLSIPSTAQGKVLFNLIRHVLDIHDLSVATTIDLQRLQIGSQLIAVVRPSSPSLLHFLV